MVQENNIFIKNNTSNIQINFNYLRSVLNYSYDDNYEKIWDEEKNETLCLVYDIIGDKIAENKLFNHDHIFRIMNDKDNFRIANTFSKDIFSFVQSLSDLINALDSNNEWRVSDYTTLRNDLTYTYCFDELDELKRQ